MKTASAAAVAAIFICSLIPARGGVPAGADTPLLNMYVHQEDDNGTRPTAGTEAVMLFEPSGVAAVYVQSEDAHIAVLGEWAWDAGRLTLRFDSGDLRADASFALDPGRDVVEMPFRLFSPEKGASKWRRRPVVPEHAARIVFRAAMLGGGAASTDEAIDRAVDYINRFVQIALGGSAPADAPVPEGFGPAQGPAAEDPPGYDRKALPKQARKLKNGIEVEYWDGRKLEIVLFGWSPPPAAPLVLTPKRLVNDPRVHLNAAPSGDTSCDPVNKTALFISPFNSVRIISWIDSLFNSAREDGIVPRALADEFAWEWIMARLAERGYKEESLLDDSVTVERLIRKFGDLKDPGVVLFYTHGTSSGALCTGEQLSDAGDPREARRRFEDVLDRLRNAGHRRLVEMDGVGMMSVELALRVPAGAAWFVSIKPAFWRYLQSLVGRPVSFKRSFFFTAACFTDDTGDLRDAVRARAYFAWKVSVSPRLNEAVCRFLVESLARPTHSAEEAYYDLVRVVNTRELVRVEDRILEGVVPTSEGGRRAPLFADLKNYLFNGYGLEGTEMVRYAGNGWLSPARVDVGQVWWLVFAGRWGQDAPQGAENLKDCYEKYWSKKQFGRLKSAYCNAANIGKIPKEAEVAYARYLLTGKKPEGYGGRVVPRWTLNESK